MIPKYTPQYTGPYPYTLFSIDGRGLFLLFLISTLAFLKILLASQMLGPIIIPDESVYANPDWTDIANLSIYSFIAQLGYGQALFFNCLVSSISAIPIFVLLRRYQSERLAAVMTVLISFYPALWLYSLTNMTEALFLTVALLAAASPAMGWFGGLIKPMGITTWLARNKYGVYLALATGLGYSILFGGLASAPIPNLILSAVHSIGYLFWATYGFFGILVYKKFTGQTDKADEYALAFTAVTAALLFAFAFRLPHEYFFGRYFDACALVILTTALKPFKKDWKLWALLGGLALLSIAYFTTIKASVLDSGLDLFYVVSLKAISISTTLWG